MIKQNNRSSIENPLPIETDLPILQQPEWRRVSFGRDYQADFCILGKNILVSRPSGYASLSDVRQSLDLRHEVIRQGIPEKNPYVQIEDYSALNGAAHEARRLFIKDLQIRKNLLALIFCNTSALFKLSVKLGMRIYPSDFNIYLKKDLSEAVRLAQDILSGTESDRKGSFQAEPPGDTPAIVSKDEWSLHLDGFDFRLEIIDGDILHSTSSGSLKKEHVYPNFELREKVFADLRPKGRKYYLLLNLKDLAYASFKARRVFVDSLNKWYRKHPFETLIFYNANWMLRAAIRIGRSTVPYTINLADDFNSAMKLIAKDKSNLLQQDPAKASLPQPRSDDRNQKYADELIDILTGINWDEQTPEAILQRVDPSHPFYPVVEAISLIKMDIDQLLKERDAFEKDLLESRKKYKNILKGMEEGYYECDLAGNYTFFNPGLCRICRYPKEKLKGMNYRRLADTDQISKIYQTFNQVYKTGRPTKAFDLKLIRGDGTTGFIELSVSLIKDSEKNPKGFRGIVRDITERIEAETERQSLEQQLRHAQKMEAIGTLAGGVAHDLNNILSGIVSYPDLLLMKIPEDSPLKKPLETIRSSGEKAAAIVSDLLTLARKGLPSLETVNLNTIIEDYLKSPEHLNLLAYHPAVKIKTNLDKNLLNMNASAVHILKTVMNLVTNAAEAMPKGGAIHITTENIYIDAPIPGYTDIKEGEYVKLQVMDEGVGIPPEDQERIFEPFYTKKRMGRSGSGLGMALVWGAVHDHNGYIHVHSIPDKGSVITVYLPATRTEADREANRFSLDRCRGNGETILVVDDLKGQRELASHMLTMLGYHADTVSSGEAAIEHIRKNPTDLVILDMIMKPGMDGLDTYKEIIKIVPSQKTIIATGYSASERIREAQSLGAGPCLKKPFLLEEIARMVREELDR